jgi:hypothetical protein
MKFRVLFVVFNVVVVVSAALIVFMPSIVMGWEYAELFWRTNWPVGIVFVVILAGLNTYFAVNWRLFSLLEREDWSGLIEYLESRLDAGKRLRSQRVRVLVNAYVATAQPEKITELEHRLRETDPQLVARNPLEFGVPYLLKNDAKEMEQYFGEMKEREDCPEPIWVRWNYGFCLMLQQRPDEARGVLVAIADETRNPVQKLLTAYLLDTISTHDEGVSAVVQRLRSELRSRYAGEKWERELERHRSSLQVLVLSRLISDAAAWAFGTGEA